MMILTLILDFSMAGVVAAQRPVTDVTASSPLVSSGGSTPNISLPNGSIGSAKIDSTQVQKRVTGTCGAGSSVAAINQDGTVACQTGNGVTDVTASPPLVSSGGSTPNISLPGLIIGRNNNVSIGGGLFSPTATGNNNAASGWLALFNNATGEDNTASGAEALFSNTTGIANTASGFLALPNNTTGNGNTASGAQSLGLNIAGSDNTASGFLALGRNSNGIDNTASGREALYTNTTGNNNTALGFRADVFAGDLTNATAIGANAVVNASNKIRLGNTDVTVIEGQVGFTASSDATKKENFQPVDGEAVLNKIQGLALSSWNFIGHNPKQFRHYGPMAQEFFAAFGRDALGTIGTPTTITSTDIEGILMIAVQALEKRTAEQREALETLKAENAALKTPLEALEK
jgi:hypothetical protein